MGVGGVGGGGRGGTQLQNWYHYGLEWRKLLSLKREAEKIANRVKFEYPGQNLAFLLPEGEVR